MRYLVLFSALLLCSCRQDLNTTESEFIETALDYQQLYVEGSVNCEKILAAMHPDIKFSENGQSWTYPELEEFCPHLPKKKVFEITNDQRLLSSTLGYDWVSQLYVNSQGDTIRETASRIWQKSDEKWFIIHMNNILNEVEIRNKIR